MSISRLADLHAFRDTFHCVSVETMFKSYHTWLFMTSWDLNSWWPLDSQFQAQARCRADNLRPFSGKGQERERHEREATSQALSCNLPEMASHLLRKNS